MTGMKSIRLSYLELHVLTEFLAAGINAKAATAKTNLELQDIRIATRISETATAKMHAIDTESHK